jgi:O-antigen ligase
MSLKNSKHFTTQNILLVLTYSFVFIFCVSQKAIYSFDTYDYLKAMPYRQLGYVLFVKGFSFIFGSYFDVAVIIFQTLFSLSAVHYFYTKVSSLFGLHLALKIPFLVLLIFPFFQPLSIANNICSEGLGYGLYLLFVATGMDILLNNNYKNLKYYAIVFLSLVFIRSQFIISTLIFAGVYFIMYRKSILHKKHLIRITFFCGIILIASVTERSYHKLKDGFFKPTPLGFTSASTAPIYVSDQEDYKLIGNADYRAIFKKSYAALMAKNLLLKPNQTPLEDYINFHMDLPKICNQTVSQQGIDYYCTAELPKGLSEKQIISYPYFEAEAACKVFTIVLIQDNFKKWIGLFYTNVTYGFYTPFLFFVVVLLFFFSLIKTVFYYKKSYAIIFLLSSLILSNALFIAFASHSIMRYLFYNYALIFLLFISTFKLLNLGSKD